MPRVDYDRDYYCKGHRGTVRHSLAESFKNGRKRCPECGHPLRTRAINRKSREPHNRI